MKLRVENSITECDKCPIVNECGGLYGLDRYEGCFVACYSRGCRNGKKWICPCRPSEYVHAMRSVGGTGAFIPPRLLSTSETLPKFIPTIHHGSSRYTALDYPIVAIPLRFMIPILKDNLTPEEFRSKFKISPQSKLMFLGVARDQYLERYWSVRRNLRWPEKLADLGFDIATSPNFSFFRDAPRTEIDYSRKRILIASGEFSVAGIPTAPHLNALTSYDWRRWGELLLEQKGVIYVAKEFQTGLRNFEEGIQAIKNLAEIQNFAGREIRPIIIGGTQYLEIISRYFKNPVFVESTPFIRTVNRRIAEMKFDYKIRWKQNLTENGDSLDEMLLHNVLYTENSINKRWEYATTPSESTRRRQRTVRKKIQTAVSGQTVFSF